MPGTDFSIGADTALNEITEICDRYNKKGTGGGEGGVGFPIEIFCTKKIF